MKEQYPIEKIIEMAAKDTVFFGRHFFPRAIRMSSPEFHYTICREIEDPRNEKVAAKVARGFAKTTLARVILAKRISFAISRTILVVSETAEHSLESVKWLKHAIERADNWAQTFKLSRGDKFVNADTGEKYTWRDDKISIVCNAVLDESGKPLIITVVGTGITGQSRGLNIEDFRPDFILLDDVLDEDNVKTGEQRRKISDRIYGAIANTLAPRSEAPTATMLFLQTPLHREDAIELAKKDPEWTYLEYGCFDENGDSRWPERWSKAELLLKKQGFIARGMLGTWLREMEVRITDDELAYFRSHWIKDNYWKTTGDIPPLHAMSIYFGVDPTPPPKDSEQQSGEALKGLDDAVICVIGCYRGHVYVLDWYKTKSPIPSEFSTQLFLMNAQYKPKKVNFETILFARTTKYYLEEQMRLQRTYFRIEPIEDRRKKSDRIRQEITELAYNSQLHVHPSHSDFIDQFISYPDVSHDDFLDALSIALMGREDSDIIEGEYEEIEDAETEYLLDNWRADL